MFLQIALSEHRVPRKFIVLGRHFPQLYNLASHRVAPPKKQTNQPGKTPLSLCD